MKRTFGLFLISLFAAALASLTSYSDTYALNALTIDACLPSIGGCQDDIYLKNGDFTVPHVLAQDGTNVLINGFKFWQQDTTVLGTNGGIVEAEFDLVNGLSDWSVNLNSSQIDMYMDIFRAGQSSAFTSVQCNVKDTWIAGDSLYNKIRCEFKTEVPMFPLNGFRIRFKGRNPDNLGQYWIYSSNNDGIVGLPVQLWGFAYLVSPNDDPTIPYLNGINDNISDSTDRIILNNSDNTDRIIQNNNDNTGALIRSNESCHNSVNLLNITNSSSSSAGVTTTWVDGVGTANGTSTGTSFLPYSGSISLSPGTYTFSVQTTSSYRYVFRVYSGSWTNYNLDANTSSVTFTTTANVTSFSIGVAGFSTGSTFTNFKIDRPMLQKGSLATSYEPFSEEICRNSADIQNDEYQKTLEDEKKANDAASGFSFNFSLPNPMSIFNFSDGCVNTPTIDSWLHLQGDWQSPHCPFIPQNVRDTLTPVVVLIVNLSLLMAIYRWVSNSAVDVASVSMASDNPKRKGGK